MRSRTLGLALFVMVAGTSAVVAQDLFAEAGHGRALSRWVNIRFLPMINMALEADDVVLVQSIDHPPKALALRIDGEAVAGDCVVTETKDTEYSVSQEDDHKKKSKWTTSSTSATTTYWAKCVFEEGVSDRARSASEVVVQVAMTNGSTKPHTLKPKELRKLQALK